MLRGEIPELGAIEGATEGMEEFGAIRGGNAVKTRLEGVKAAVKGALAFVNVWFVT